MAGRTRGRLNRRFMLLAFAAALVTAAVLRVLYFRELTADAALTVPLQDAQYHDFWARALVTGDWRAPEGMADPDIAAMPYFRPPGYPYFLAAVYRLTSPEPRMGVAANMVLGVANVALAFAVGAAWLGPATGLAAAWLMAACWPFLFFEGLLLDPVLHVTLLLLVLLALLRFGRRPRVLAAVAAGAALGLACLVRPTTLLFIPLAAGWAAWAALRRRVPRGRALWAGVALLGAAALAILPATLRNALTTRDPVLISANGGLMFYMGNGPGAMVFTETAALNRIQQGKYRSCFDYPALAREIQARTGLKRYSEVSAWLAGEAWRNIRAEPLAFARRTLAKALLFLGPIEIGHNSDIRYRRAGSRLLRSLPAPFPLVLALAIVGCAVRLRRPRSRDGEPGGFDVLVTLLAVVYFASLLPFVFSSQYRVPLLLFLLFFAGSAVQAIFAHVASGRYRAAFALALPAAMIWGLTSLIGRGHESTPARWHYERAYAYRQAGDPAGAEREYLRAIEAEPRHAWAHGDLGTLLAESGRLAKAIEHLRVAVALEPDYPKARVNLGFALHLQGQTDQGIEQLEFVLERDGNHVDALNALAWIRATHPGPGFRNPAEAVGLASKACKLTHRRVAAYLDTLAAAYAAEGQFDLAAETAKEAARLESTAGNDKQAEAMRLRAAQYQTGVPLVIHPGQR